MSQLASVGGDTAADREAAGSGETLAPEPYVLHAVEGPLSRGELVAIDAWWRAANYIAIAVLFRPLAPVEHERHVPVQGLSGQ